jgi:Icc-related predicted phosphoesterase
VVSVAGYDMISCEWVNETPWKTPRQCSDEELEKRLEREFDRASDKKRLVCNFHAPPHNTRIDEAPKLDKNHKPVTKLTLVVKEHVGSVAVRKTLERHQPVIGLHGHIHESEGSDQIGRTLVLNPGSEYEAGVFKGFIVSIPKEQEKGVSFQRVEG